MTPSRPDPLVPRIVFAGVCFVTLLSMTLIVAPPASPAQLAVRVGVCAAITAPALVVFIRLTRTTGARR